MAGTTRSPSRRATSQSRSAPPPATAGSRRRPARSATSRSSTAWAPPPTASRSPACAATARSGTRPPERTAMDEERSPRRPRTLLVATVAAALAAIVTGALLINIFERKQEARNPFFRVVELTERSDDPALWGKNFPYQYDAWRRTVDQQR